MRKLWDRWDRFWSWIADRIVGDITYWADLTDEPGDE